MISTASSSLAQKSNQEQQQTESSSDNNLLNNQLYQLSEGWLELESDPGLFTLLISDFGCNGVEVEEIYDLATPFTQQIYGFIFLFNVVEERRSRSKSPSSLLSGEYIENEDFLKTTFFAYQKVPNSCATHAILSVLMNCDQIDIGPTLRNLKTYTKDMTPENKGYAIGNMAELARAHNSHAAPVSSQIEQQMKQNTNAVRMSQRNLSSCEAFHFVSFVPINGRLIELDGLKEYPIDHGSFTETGVESWTEMFRQLIRKRIETPYGVSHDIRYNLMAVIPNKCYRNKIMLKTLENNRKLALDMFDFLEFSSDYCHLNEHNYSEGNFLETKYSAFSHPYPYFPFDKRLNLNMENDLVEADLQDDSQAMMDCDDPPSPCSVNTDTASEANSTFNYLEDVIECNEMVTPKDRFILCKLVNSRQDADSSDYLPPLESYSSSPDKVVNHPNNNNVNCIDQHSSKLINGECSQSQENSHPAPNDCQSDQNHQDLSPTNNKSNSQQLLSSVKKQYQQLQDYRRQSIHPRHEFEIRRRILIDLQKLLRNLGNEIRKCKAVVRDEEQKLKRFSEDDMRRIHDYDPFISTFLAMFSEQGLMEQFISGELCNNSQTPSHYPLSTANTTSSHHHPNSANSNSSNSQEFLTAALHLDAATGDNIPNSVSTNYDARTNLFLPLKFPYTLNSQNRDSVLATYKRLFRSAQDSQSLENQENEEKPSVKKESVL